MRALSVPEVTAYLRDLIERDDTLADLWISGEVSNLSRSAAGHMYFNVVGDGAQIACVLFRGNQRGILAMPRNGDEIFAHGRIAIYEARGQYQLMVDNVAPIGIGIQQLQFEETRRRLEAEGLFAIDRKRPLPSMPATIGVVTSAQGAVWHDIQTVVRRRFPLTSLVLAPSDVQGANAPRDLIRALAALQDDGRADVIIIGRGGGAAEDLAAFNDEDLARAIFRSTIPVVSAVGHETDTCIADLVADVRAATPSAAAEQCVPDQTEIRSTLRTLLSRSHVATLAKKQHSDTTLASLTTRVLHLSPQGRVDRARISVDALTEAARQHTARHLAICRTELAHYTAAAKLLDPSSILKRGYAIVTQINGPHEQRVATAREAGAATTLRVAFHDGAVDAQVVRGQHE